MPTNTITGTTWTTPFKKRQRKGSTSDCSQHGVIKSRASGDRDPSFSMKRMPKSTAGCWPHGTRISGTSSGYWVATGVPYTNLRQGDLKRSMTTVQSGAQWQEVLNVYWEKN